VAHKIDGALGGLFKNFKLSSQAGCIGIRKRSDISGRDSVILLEKNLKLWYLMIINKTEPYLII